MKIKHIYILVLLICSEKSFTQINKSNLDLLQGKWENTTDEGLKSILQITGKKYTSSITFIDGMNSKESGEIVICDECSLARGSDSTHFIYNDNGGYLFIFGNCYEMTIESDELSLSWEDRPSSVLRYKRIKLNKSTSKVFITNIKSPIFSSPNIPTKMYLLKHDEVEVIAEKDNWLHIKYYGKKIVEGWIRKKDTEL